MTVELKKLDNGIKIATDSFSNVETVAVGIWVNVGARNEPAEINGISHLLEHMAFKGTTTRSAQQIADEIESVGGYLNAATSRETTAYYARVLKEDLGTAVDILSDILQNSTFATEELEKEREVVIQEIYQTNDTPDDVIYDHFQNASYADQAMGRAILGTKEIVSSVTREQLHDYLHNNYDSKRIVVAASGNLDPKYFADLVEQKLSMPVNCDVNFQPSNYTGGFFHEERKIEQVHYLLGFQGVGMGHEDYYTQSILATILGGGMSSRLFQELREKRGLVYSTYAFRHAFSDSGLFGVYAGTSKKHVPEVIKVLQDQLSNITHNLVNESELNRVKAQFKAGLMMSLESTSSRLDQIANQTIFYGHPISTQEIMAKINAVTIEDVRQVAQNIFSSAPTQTSIGSVKLDQMQKEFQALGK